MRCSHGHSRRQDWMLATGTVWTPPGRAVAAAGGQEPIQLQTTPDLNRLSDRLAPETKNTQKRTRGLQRVRGKRHCQRCGQWISSNETETNATSIRLRRRWTCRRRCLCSAGDVGQSTRGESRWGQKDGDMADQYEWSFPIPYDHTCIM